jgi:dihydrodipicolinate synthase/N-acetylneuraminate lyase
MLTKENLRGVWASIVMPWDKDGNFDEATFRENAAKLVEAGVHGIYTTGSTGEFYALDFDEFEYMVDVFADETVGKTLTQVGCTWINTRDSIRMARYAADKGIDGVQVGIPFWMALNDDEVLRYFIDLSQACPDVGIVHYNTGRAKRFLTGRDYQCICDKVPNLIGTKYGSSEFAAWMELQINGPELNHFVGEGDLVMGMMFGAKGMYCSHALMNPKFMLDWYGMCERGEWDEAIKIQWRISRWLVKDVYPLITAGHLDPTLDKAFQEMAGWLKGSRWTRPPHDPLSDEEMARLIEGSRQHYPEAFEYVKSVDYEG